MSDVNAPSFGSPANLPAAEKPASGTWDGVEAALERGSELLNPILVKESRQALKSKLFAIAFALFLILGWGWSLLGIAILTPGIYYAPGGPTMLFGYFVVLAAPMILLVPFAAFRSLAAEREDGTYELLAITDLKPRQIVGGKLGSAVLQMLVFFSAISPCVAFTYLLRGIDILMIGTLLFYLFLLSVLLSVLGLLLATVTREKHWQVVLSVIIVLVLGVLFIISLYAGGALLGVNPVMPYDNPDFWIVHFGVLTGYASYFLLFYVAAAARITFASENRSTRLRVVMLAQHVLLLGWFAYLRVRNGDPEGLLSVYLILATVHWYVMGVFMTGEAGVLSSRARRRLPQSGLSRALLTWFNPGPGTGYVFAVANLFAAALVVMGSMFVAQFITSSDWDWQVVAVALAASCYLIIFLGVGRLLLVLLQQFIPAGMAVSVLIHLAMLLLACLGPYVLQLSLFGDDNYTPLQVTNPLWTLTALADDYSAWEYVLPLGPFPIPVVLLILLAAAGLMLPIQLLIAARELPRHSPAPAPARVEEEERELHPPPPPTPTSPWDVPPQNGADGTVDD